MLPFAVLPSKGKLGTRVDVAVSRDQRGGGEKMRALVGGGGGRERSISLSVYRTWKRTGPRKTKWRLQWRRFSYTMTCWIIFYVCLMEKFLTYHDHGLFDLPACSIEMKTFTHNAAKLFVFLSLFDHCVYQLLLWGRERRRHPLISPSSLWIYAANAFPGPLEVCVMNIHKKV